MNTPNHRLALSAEDRFGQRLAVRLSDTTGEIPHEISERLKSARVLALSKRKTFQIQTAGSVEQMGQTAALHLGGGKFNLWGRVGLIFPLIALVAGLLVIQIVQDEFGEDELATVDSELLTDVLPPSAYADPGFAQYLRTSGRD